MKKLIALILTFIMTFMFVSCTQGADDTASTDSVESTESVAAQSDLEYVKQKGKMVIGITDYAPMNYKEEGSDEWTGFDTEFAEAVCKEIGVDAEFFVLADWGAKVNELNAKTIDAVWNGMTILPELQESMSISDPYVVNAQVIVCKEANKDTFATVESIKDAAIAVEGGSAAEELVADYANVTPCQNMANTLLEVQSGAADVAIIDITMAQSMTGEGTSYSDLTYTASLSEEEYGIGFRKGSDICTKVNEIMSEMKADGTLKALADKYELTLAE